MAGSALRTCVAVDRVGASGSGVFGSQVRNPAGPQTVACVRRAKTVCAASGEDVEQETPTGTQKVTLSLEDVNPIGLGRRSREIFDGVWRKLTELGQLTSSPRADDYELEKVLIGGPMCEFTIPNADLTTVLVAGATGRVGRILVRKLLLRGYKVKVGSRWDWNRFPAIMHLD